MGISRRTMENNEEKVEIDKRKSIQHIERGGKKKKIKKNETERE